MSFYALFINTFASTRAYFDSRRPVYALSFKRGVFALATAFLASFSIFLALGRYNDSNLVAESITRPKKIGVGKAVAVENEQIVVEREDHAAGANIEATELLQVRLVLVFFWFFFFFSHDR